MLSHLAIQNFILLDRLELNFTDGLTVLTGETGAGKSILIDALALILGDRADSNFIGNFQDRCDLAAIFTIEELPVVKDWLKTNDYATEERECILRRILFKDGKSRQTINGSPCTIAHLKELSSLLINIHSQNQHQLLLKPSYQRELLDSFAGLQKEVEQLKNLYQNYQQNLKKLQSLKKSQENYEVQNDLLTFQIQEFEKINLGDGEYEQIDVEHRQLANADNFIMHCQEALQLLCEDEPNIQTMLHHAQQSIQHLQSSGLDTSNQLLNEAGIQISEAINDIRSFLNQIEINPERLHFLENRLMAIHTLSRKYHTTPAELLGVYQSLRESLQALQNVQEDILAVENACKTLCDEYLAAAKSLHDKRKTAGDTLSKNVSQSIKKLGMPTGNFKVQVEWSEQNASIHGCDNIEFLISTNPGHTPQPLRKIASGGEMSRLALVIYLATAKSNTTPILVFDEIDVGIGGSTAAIVGELLKALGEKVQIFCITHLPQVAAFSDQHFKVEKTITKKSSETSIKLLSADEKIKEIARMLGGVTVTERTLAHAKELVDVAG